MDGNRPIRQNDRRTFRQESTASICMSAARTSGTPHLRGMPTFMGQNGSKGTVLRIIFSATGHVIHFGWAASTLNRVVEHNSTDDVITRCLTWPPGIGGLVLGWNIQINSSFGSTIGSFMHSSISSSIDPNLFVHAWPPSKPSIGASCEPWGANHAGGALEAESIVRILKRTWIIEKHSLAFGHDWVRFLRLEIGRDCAPTNHTLPLQCCWQPKRVPII